MSASRVVVLAVLALVASGCAGPQARQELARLQSQVGLLEERISQLERSGTGGLSSLPVSEPGFETGAVITPPGSVTTPSPRSTGSSAKPSTRQIQQALKNAGFYQGAVDGKSGPLTKDAVKEFQRVHGLTDDGVVGRQTWAKLKAYADLSSNGEATAAESFK